MDIQCPKCQSKYRTKVVTEAQKPIPVNCPKCAYRFLVASTDENSGDGQPKKILIVDDARFFRELLLDLLVEREAVLATANNSRDAWQMLHKEAFDLLIVDINLPDIDGLKLIAKIRSTKGLETLKILCVSGVYRQEGDARKALLAGADDFISKSFNGDELNQRIDALLGQ